MISVGIEDFGKTSLDRAELLLAGIPGGLEKAVNSAMSRTAQYVRTQASKRVRERYAISAGDLRTDSNVKINYRYTPGAGVEASIRFSGRKIPLYRFSGASPKTPTQSPEIVNILINGRWVKAHPGVAASGHQLKDTAPTRFQNAFVAAFGSGHIGIFERTGGVTAGGRDEIKELMGSSIPQMIGNEEVLESLAKDATDKFDERLAHEVDAVLNGWR